MYIVLISQTLFCAFVFVFVGRVLEEVNFEAQFKELPEYHPEDHVQDISTIPLTPHAIVSSYRRKRNNSQGRWFLSLFMNWAHNHTSVRTAWHWNNLQFTNLTVQTTCSLPTWGFRQLAVYHFDGSDNLQFTNLTVQTTCILPTWQFRQLAFY